MERSSIQVSASLRRSLERRKQHPRESYEEVIERALRASKAAPAPVGPTTLPAPVREVLAEIQGALARLYGARSRRLILYGSYARGEAHEDSDIDVLLVLAGEVEPTREISRIVGITYEILLERGVHVSVMPMSEQEFLTRASPLLMNVRREGVPL